MYLFSESKSWREDLDEQVPIRKENDENLENNVQLRKKNSIGNRRMAIIFFFIDGSPGNLVRVFRCSSKGMARRAAARSRCGCEAMSWPRPRRHPDRCWDAISILHHLRLSPAIRIFTPKQQQDRHQCTLSTIIFWISSILFFFCFF